MQRGRFCLRPPAAHGPELSFVWSGGVETPSQGSIYIFSIVCWGREEMGASCLLSPQRALSSRLEGMMKRGTKRTSKPGSSSGDSKSICPGLASVGMVSLLTVKPDDEPGPPPLAGRTCLCASSSTSAFPGLAADRLFPAKLIVSERVCGAGIQPRVCVEFDAKAQRRLGRARRHKKQKGRR